MRKRIVNHNPDSDGRVNHIFGIFEAGGSIFSSLINKESQDSTNRMNNNQWLQEVAYKKERDAIEDARYEDETAYNRLFAEDERDYQRALQQTLFEREDTAIERQASQLSKLGINPLSQNMNGLPAGQALSTTPAPSASTRSVSDQLPQLRQQAFTGFDLGLSSDFLNQIDTLQTNGVQRDLLRSQENFQRLQNLAFANSHGIKLDENGNPISIAPDVSEQDLRKEDLNFKKEHNRNEKASANRNARVDEMQYLTGATDRTSSVLQPAYDASYQANVVSTNIKRAYNNHVDKPVSSDDSNKTTLSDRLSQVKNMAFGYAASKYIKFQKFLKNLTKKNDAIVYGSVHDYSGRMR